MDPLVEILPEVQDMIFLHWDAVDFRNVTEVSPSWSEIIERSLVMMKNVKLNLERLFYTKNLVKFRSTRRYRNVTVGFEGRVPGDERFQRLIEFLAKLGPLTELCLDEVCTLSLLEEELLLHKIDISRLKVLKLHSVAEDLCFVNEMLNRCHSLTRIELFYVQKRYDKGALLNHQEVVTPPSIPSLLPFFLEQNPDLQELELRGREFYKLFFSNDVSELVRFKLKRLKIVYPENPYLIPKAIEQNLLKFLAKQSQSLESFHIYDCRQNLFEHVFNKMPKLTTLHIFDEVIGNRLQLNRNENILELGLYFIDSSANFEIIVRAAPKATTLTVGKLTSAKLEIVARNLPELRRLQFNSCERLNYKPIWISLWPHAVERNISHDYIISHFCSVEK